MIRAERRDLRDIVAHVRDGLTRHRENEVEVEPFEARPMRPAHSRARLLRAMYSPEEFQYRGIERLRAEADSIDARRSHSGQLHRVHRSRIGLQRDLGVRFESKAPLRRLEYAANRLRRKQRRRAATEEDRA